MIDFASAAASNRRRSGLLIALLAFIALATGLALDASGPGLPLFTLGRLGGTVGGTLLADRSGDAMVLASLRARPVDEAIPEQAQFANLVEEMAVSAGLPTPRVMLVDDPAPNALATGRDPEHATIAATTGLLATLDRAETQGVVAHEMAHVGNRDTRIGVVLAVLLGAIALVADFAWRLGMDDDGNDRDRSLGPIFLLAAALAPVASRLVAFAISRQREYLADATAVELTRNPLALASALERISSHPRPTRRGVQGTAHLFFAAPRTTWGDRRRGWLADLWATHPPVADRIARLLAMAGAGDGSHDHA